MRVLSASAHSIFSCLTKASERRFPPMSICPRFDVKISSGNHLSIKYITERNSHGITWLEMFQMTILYLHLFKYSRQHKAALIFKKILGLRKLGTLCFKYLVLLEEPNSYRSLREGSNNRMKPLDMRNRPGGKDRWLYAGVICMISDQSFISGFWFGGFRKFPVGQAEINIEYLLMPGTLPGHWGCRTERDTVPGPAWTKIEINDNPLYIPMIIILLIFMYRAHCFLFSLFARHHSRYWALDTFLKYERHI